MLKKIPIRKEIKEKTQEKLNRAGGIFVNRRLKKDCTKRFTFLLHPDAVAAVDRLKKRFSNQPLFLTVSHLLIFAEQEIMRRGLSVESDLEVELGL